MSNSPQKPVNQIEVTDEQAPVARATPSLPPQGARKSANASQFIRKDLQNNEKMAQKFLESIEEGMNAETSVWNAGAGDFVRQPDYKTRLQAAQLYAAHVLGLPIARADAPITDAQPTAQDEEDMLVKSPAARDALRRQLEAAERKAAALELQKNPAPAVGP